MEEKFFELFWVLTLQVFSGKSNIFVDEVSRTFKISAKALIGQ